MKKKIFLKSVFFYFACILAATVVSFELDFFVPSFPMLKENFFLSTVELSRLISVNVLGLTIGNFIFGPMSDIYGRRKILLIGLLLFTISSFLCGASSFYKELLFARFLQGFSASAGIILVSSMIMDIHTENESKRLLSFFNGLITASMAGAPLIGNFILPFFGWRGAFYIISIFGFTAFLAIYFFCPETKRESNKSHFSIKKLLTSYKKQISSKKFLQLGSIPALLYSSLIVFITFFPIILINYLKIQQCSYGWYHGLIMLSFCLSSLVFSYSKNQIFLNRLFNVGFFFICIALVVFLLIGINFIAINAILITCIMIIFMIGMAFCFSKYIVDAIYLFPVESGTTFASLGGIKLILTALSVEFASQLSKFNQAGTFLAMAIIIAIAVKLHWSHYVSNKR